MSFLSFKTVQTNSKMYRKYFLEIYKLIIATSVGTSNVFASLCHSNHVLQTSAVTNSHLQSQVKLVEISLYF